MRIVLSDKARADLLRIFQYLEERSPTAANDFIRRIDENFKNLARFPFIGRERSQLALGLRCLIVGVHLIFYTITGDDIAIVRVIDGRMDVDEEFQR
jgi:toxin ParE1/3/4